LPGLTALVEAIAGPSQETHLSVRQLHGFSAFFKELLVAAHKNRWIGSRNGNMICQAG